MEAEVSKYIPKDRDVVWDTHRALAVVSAVGKGGTLAMP